jgi:hypothetical protein
VGNVVVAYGLVHLVVTSLLSLRFVAYFSAHCGVYMFLEKEFMFCSLGWRGNVFSVGILGGMRLDIRVSLSV